MRIYRVYNKEDNTSYIGQTKQVLSERLRDHVRKATHRGRNNKLSQAIRKFGPEAFAIEELYFAGPFDFNSPEELQEHIDLKEKEFIEIYDSIDNGYNIRKGGQGYTERKELTPEEKAKKEEERKARHKVTCKKYYEENKEEILAKRKTPEKRAKQKARLDRRYALNPGKREEDQEKHKIYMRTPEKRAEQKARHRNRMLDPEYKKEFRAKKRESKAKRKSEVV